MSGSILARHRRLLREETFAMTAAQAVAVHVAIVTDPIAKARPDFAAIAAAEAGFPLADETPQRGLAAALAHHGGR